MRARDDGRQALGAPSDPAHAEHRRNAASGLADQHSQSIVCGPAGGGRRSQRNRARRGRRTSPERVDHDPRKSGQHSPSWPRLAELIPRSASLASWLSLSIPQISAAGASSAPSFTALAPTVHKSQGWRPRRSTTAAARAAPPAPISTTRLPESLFRRHRPSAMGKPLPRPCLGCPRHRRLARPAYSPTDTHRFRRSVRS